MVIIVASGGGGHGGGVTKLQYAVSYFAFMSILIFVSNQSGVLFVSGNIVPPPTPSLTDLLGNVSYFLTAMTISSTYQLLYLLVLVPLTIGMGICIYEWLTDLIP